MLAQFTFILNIWTFSFSSGTLFSAKPQSTNNETAKKRNRKKKLVGEVAKKKPSVLFIYYTSYYYSATLRQTTFFLFFTKINIRSDSVYLAALHFTVRDSGIP